MTKKNTMCNEAETKVADEAADWLLRLNGKEEPDPEALAGWHEWVSVSDQNRQAYYKMLSVWRLSNGLNEASAPAAVREWRLQSSQEKNWYQGVIGKCATVLQRPVYGLTAMALVAMMVAAVQFIPHSLGERYYSTEIGQNQSLTLDDGSRVELGAMSEIKVAYTNNRRDIYLLSGEAYFEAAKETGRPFVVKTNHGSVRAIGTGFNVRQGRRDAVVTVVEGVVAVNSRSDSEGLADFSEPFSSRLEAGHQLRFALNKPLPDVMKVDPRIATSWRGTSLVFSEASLQDVLDDLNRYQNDRLIEISPEVADLKYTGLVKVEALSNWLAALELSFPVEVYAEEDKALIYKKK